MMYAGIDPVAVVGAATAAAQFDPQQTAAPRASVPGAFAQLMEQQLGDLNASVVAAEMGVRDLAAGKSVELHEVMIGLERARISVQTFVQVRNKLIESYQDLMRMQL